MSIFTTLASSPAAAALQLLSPSSGHGSKANAANGKAASPASTSGTGSGSSSGSDAFSVNNLGSTFLNLLIQELQNQDPTSPMDPTAMVGQMISLNQLSQLIGINQALTPTSTATTPTSGQSAAAAVQAALAALSPSSPQTASSAADLGNLPQTAAAQANSFQPGTAAAAAFYGHGLVNGTPAAPLNLSNFSFASGGK